MVKSVATASQDANHHHEYSIGLFGWGIPIYKPSFNSITGKGNNHKIWLLKQAQHPICLFFVSGVEPSRPNIQSKTSAKNEIQSHRINYSEYGTKENIGVVFYGNLEVDILSHVHAPFMLAKSSFPSFLFIRKKHTLKMHFIRTLVIISNLFCGINQERNVGCIYNPSFQITS